MLYWPMISAATASARQSSICSRIIPVGQFREREMVTAFLGSRSDPSTTQPLVEGVGGRDSVGFSREDAIDSSMREEADEVGCRAIRRSAAAGRRQRSHGLVHHRWKHCLDESVRRSRSNGFGMLRCGTRISVRLPAGAVLRMAACQNPEQHSAEAGAILARCGYCYQRQSLVPARPGGRARSARSDRAHPVRTESMIRSDNSTIMT